MTKHKQFQTVWYELETDSIFIFDGETAYTQYAPGLYIHFTAKTCAVHKSQLVYIGDFD